MVLQPDWQWGAVPWAQRNAGTPTLPGCATPRSTDKNCPVHRRPCVNRKEENYFFALSKYQKELEELCSNPGGWAGGHACAGPRTSCAAVELLQREEARSYFEVAGLV